MYVHLHEERGKREQRPALGQENLHVGAVSRHRLDSLNTSNDLLKKKKDMCT